MKFHRWSLPIGLIALVATVVPMALAAAATETRPVYAHRGGASEFVENTRPAYAHAAAAGSLRWETDVRFTSTNYPVLLHDADLRRFNCPTVKIAEVSVPAARTCAAANGQTLTTLFEFVTDLTASKAQAMVELKTVPTAAQWTILQTRIEALKDRIVIESFLPAALAAASEKGYATAFLSSTAVTPANLPAGVDWYAPDWSTLTAGQVTAMHVAGVKVVAWTPDCADWPAVPAAVDALISNDLVSACT